MADMTDAELTLIEAEVASYQLADFPITGVQLHAIIDRLRRAERAADYMQPYMIYYMDKNRLRRANEAWSMTRAATFMFSIVVGISLAGVTGMLKRFAADPDILNSGYAILTVLIGSIVTLVPLMGWIDREQNRRLVAGKYDDVKAARREMQIANYKEYYGAQQK